MQMAYPDYPDEIFTCFALFEPDTDYYENYKQYCDGVLLSNMNVKQIRMMLTFIERGERFCSGHIQRYLENSILLKLLLQLDDLITVYDQKKDYSSFRSK
ncbi:MAG: DUF6508 domain-containing protein [Bulleidia sp.]